jgi:hypothetical protein
LGVAPVDQIKVHVPACPSGLAGGRRQELDRLQT